MLCQYAFTAPSANIAAFQHCSIEPSQLAMPERDTMKQKKPAPRRPQ
jgi:hypothetical protein